MKKNFKNVLLYIGIPIVFLLTMFSVSYITKDVAKTKYSDIVQMIKANEVSDFELNLYSGQLIYTRRDDGQKYRYTVAEVAIFLEDINDTAIIDIANPAFWESINILSITITAKYINIIVFFVLSFIITFLGTKFPNV